METRPADPRLSPAVASPAAPSRPGQAAGSGTDRLHAAGREFERLLVEQMLVSMQASLEEGLFPQEGVGGEWYTSLFNQEMSREMTAGKGLGLSAALLEQLRQAGGSDADSQARSLSTGAAGGLGGGLPARGLPVHGLASLDRAFALRRMDHGQVAKPALGALDRQAELGRAARPTYTRPGGERVEELRSLTRDVAREVGVDPRLAMALVEAESGWDEHARSRKGAMGLTQLMPDTARGLGVRDPFDARQNLKGGLTYLRDMLDRFQDQRLALAAYNAGPGTVDRSGGIPPYAETRAYVSRIEKLMGRTP